MEENQEKWTEAVLNSMEGARRASPGPDLLDKIEARLLEEKSFVQPKRQLNWLAVAAGLLLLAMNGIAVLQYSQNQSTGDQQVTSQESGLISDFDFYEL